jgi:hypothetical protein
MDRRDGKDNFILRWWLGLQQKTHFLEGTQQKVQIFELVTTALMMV